MPRHLAALPRRARVCVASQLVDPKRSKLGSGPLLEAHHGHLHASLPIQ
jgi:hypothetical protein